MVCICVLNVYFNIYVHFLYSKSTNIYFYNVSMDVFSREFEFITVMYHFID